MSMILIRGGGDLASGVAACLFRAGHKVLISELRNPASVRRRVSFSEAVYSGQTSVEEIKGRLAVSIEDVILIQDEGEIPIIVDPDMQILSEYSAEYLIDARMVKRRVENDLEFGLTVIGLGPGFLVGENCHYAIETMRGETLGEIISNGSPLEDTGIPGLIGNKSAERVLRAPTDGKPNHFKEIGENAMKGEIITEVGGMSVTAPFDGVIRGIIHPDLIVHKGMKIGDIDPRNDIELCFSISDKAVKIGESVLKIIQESDK